MTNTVTVLVGTTKGVFLIDSDQSRGKWDIRGPLCDGWPINHMASDPDTGDIYAAGGSQWHGAGVWKSTDSGVTWTLSKLAGGQMDEWLANDEGFRQMLGITEVKPAPYTGEIENMWSISFVGDRILAGAKPATLFASTDKGETWEKVDGLNTHPSRDTWEPGGAGLILHTIVADPADRNKAWVGISAAGIFATEDGGATWDRRNRRSNEDHAHDHHHAHERPHTHGPEVGYCVHNMVRAAGSGDVLYQQNHHGVFRSTDGGRSWNDISEGLPTNYGFPIAVHPTDVDTAWVIPLNGDMAGRFPPGASAKVWRTRDGGASWEGLQNGLPVKDCYFTVLRQSMANDTKSPAGVYFGTNSGSVFCSADEGDVWQEIAQHLPTVLCVEVRNNA